MIDSTNLGENSGDDFDEEGAGSQTENFDSPQLKVAHAVEDFMNDLNTECRCDVDVKVEGLWCTFEGTVGTQEIRTSLFDLVPAYNGRRYIVDRLHVTYGVELEEKE